MQKGCPKCGRMINENTRVCPYCKYNFKEIDGFFKRVADEKFLENEKYAGLIKRLVAGLFDIFFTLVLTYFILVAIDSYLMPVTLDNLYIAIYIFVPLYILYNSIMERTSWRGSLGKYILNIEVTDEYENPITFPKAILRNITKVLNIITVGIGILLSAVPPKKQALNDRISHTLVLNKLKESKKVEEFYASPLKRLVAFIIDVLIIGLVCYGIYALADFLESLDITLQTSRMIDSTKFILCLLIIFFYFPFAESHSGSTFGKKRMRIKVAKLNGDLPGFIRCFTREIVMLLDFITLGFLLVFANKQRQTLKDILTRTIVIDR